MRNDPGQSWRQAEASYLNQYEQECRFAFRPGPASSLRYRRLDYEWLVDLKLAVADAEFPFKAGFAASHFADLDACLDYLAQEEALYDAFLPFLEQDLLAEKTSEPNGLYRDVGVIIIPA